MADYVFPTVKERRQLLSDLNNLEHENELEILNNEEYKSFREALDLLNNTIEEYSVNDEDGLPIIIDKDKKERLMNLIIATAIAGEKYLKSMYDSKENLNEGIPKMVNKIQGYLSKDYDTLRNYNIDSGLSLTEIYERSRILIIDMDGNTINTVGNKQSSRFPMNIKDSYGNQRAGVFTKARYNHVKTDVLNCFARAKEACNQNGRDQIDRIIPGYNERLAFGGKTKSGGEFIKYDDSPDFVIGHLLKALSEKTGGQNKELTKSKLKTFLRENARINTDAISGNAITILTNGLNEIKKNLSAEVENYGLELIDGDRIDNRNSGMSAVADLLGISDLIARSDNMKYKDENGNIVDGSFMDYGKGLDLSRDNSLFRHVAPHPYSNNNIANRSKLFRQLADIQVLDFLCNNVDRHPGNLLYQVDREGNIIGIQGIDNDSSFGTSKTNDDDDILRLKVMSNSMWKKISKITPEELKFSLRGKGLREDELEAATVRLKNLKSAVKKGIIKVMYDESMGRVRLESLYADKEVFIRGQGTVSMPMDNIFSDIASFILRRKRKCMQDGYGFVPYEGDYRHPVLEVIGATERRGTVGGVEDTLRKVFKYHYKVEDGLINYRGRSEAFFNLVTSVQRSNELFRNLISNNTIDKTAMLTDIGAKQVLKDAHRVFSDLYKKADTYLKEKARNKGVASVANLVGKNTYEQKHIDYAKRMIKLSDEFFAQVAGPSNDREREEITRNYERKLAEDMKKVKTEIKKNKGKADLIIK